MTIDNAINKKQRYISLSEMKMDDKRDYIVKEIESIRDKIQEKMFDSWDVENFYLIGEILEKDKNVPKNVCLFIEINKDKFEELVDSKYIKEIINLGNIQKIKPVFNVEGYMWEYNDKIWQKGDKEPNFKILI